MGNEKEKIRQIENKGEEIGAKKELDIKMIFEMMKGEGRSIGLKLKEERLRS